MFEANGQEREQLAEWVLTFGDHVRTRRFDDAEVMFDRSVVSFSSLRDVVVGLDVLVDQQWRFVWPTIEEFRFDVGSMHALLSPDGALAAVAVTWTSTGFDADGRPFPRPGRASLVLARQAPGEAWRCVHAHFSLNRGVPQQSFGRAPSA
jgi:ketosteroid isomerase-like protein